MVDTFYVENKNVLGLIVQAQVTNLLKARDRIDRNVCDGIANCSPLAFGSTRAN